MHNDLAETGALRLQFLPEPRRHFFNRRVLQTVDIVQIRVVQHFQEWFHRVANLRMIVNPSDFWIDVALDRNFDLKTVPMDASAFVAGRGIRQSLRRFKSEILRQARFHESEDTIALPALSSRTK
jgi:hypothetical protein